jgi:hypothetical protein
MACSTPELPPQTSVDYSAEILSRKPDASKVAAGEGVRLSGAMNRNLSETPVTPERKGMLLLIEKLKRRGRGDDAFETCSSRYGGAPECNVLKSGWADTFFEDEIEQDDSDSEIALKASQRNSKVKLTRSFKKKHSRVIDAVYRNLMEGKIEKVEGQIEGDFYRALKRVDSWTPEIEELTKKLAKSGECADPEAYVYLGLKGEEFFPDEEKMKRVLELYEKADSCNLENATNKYVQLARFRLGLLAIVKKDCDQAQKVFNRLAKMGVNDYSTRAHYWSAYCARAGSRKEEFLASFDELFRMNPLGFHTLSINYGDSILVDNLSKPIDPIVKTRAGSEGGFNMWIRMLEDYDQLGEFAMVRRLLTPVRKNPEYLLKLEPGVRLYLSTFAWRARDTFSLFRMLDSVFRTQSEYVVDSTLKLFYPLKFIEQIVQGSKRVNPLLVASLIRQESAFQEDARSRVGAMGLMQLMPATARLMDRSVRRSQLLKPEVNIKLGIRYFEILVDRYEGDVELALAAYNAGAEVVDRWKKRYPTKNRLLFLDLMPYAETRNYVTLIGRNYYWYSKIYGETVKAIAGSTGTANSEFRGLKPE